MYIAAAHQEGATRAQAVFATAPFVGAALSWFVLGETFDAPQVAAGGLLIASVALLLLDHHEHFHAHEPLGHIHAHRHDDGHHLHEHPGLPASGRHTHWHHHESGAPSQAPAEPPSPALGLAPRGCATCGRELPLA